MCYFKVALEVYLPTDFISFFGSFRADREIELPSYLEDYFHSDVSAICVYGKKEYGVGYSTLGNTTLLKWLGFVADIIGSLIAQPNQRLCRKLLRKRPRKTILFIFDNAQCNCNKMLAAWTRAQQVELVYLPNYSLNLKLIERLWHFLQQREIRLVSMTGSLVSKQTLSGELGQVRLSLEGQKPGVYFLQVISSSGEITTKKIIKQ